MAGYRFALDENVSRDVALVLRAEGHEIESAVELGRLRLSDVQVLVRAAEASQVLVTHNRRDFVALHEAWMAWRSRWEREVERAVGAPVPFSHHSGIVLVPGLSSHELAVALRQFDGLYGPLDDRLFEWSANGGGASACRGTAGVSENRDGRSRCLCLSTGRCSASPGIPWRVRTGDVPAQSNRVGPGPAQDHREAGPRTSLRRSADVRLLQT